MGFREYPFSCLLRRVDELLVGGTETCCVPLYSEALHLIVRYIDDHVALHNRTLCLRPSTHQQDGYPQHRREAQ